MITADQAKQIGIKPEDEKSPLEILGDNAMTTREIADKLSSYFPKDYPKMTYSCAKQKMIRLEMKGHVDRRKVKGLIHWMLIQPKQ